MQRRTTTPTSSRPSPCPTDEPLATIALTAGSSNRWDLRSTSRLGLKALERREPARKVGLPERRIDISDLFASVGARRHMPERRREAPCWWHAPAGACRASGLVLPAKPALPTWVASNETGRRGFSVCLYSFLLEGEEATRHYTAIASLAHVRRHANFDVEDATEVPRLRHSIVHKLSRIVNLLNCSFHLWDEGVSLHGLPLLSENLTTL